MTLNEFKNYMKGYKDALGNAPTDADCRKMLERIFELIETVPTFTSPGQNPFPAKITCGHI